MDRLILNTCSLALSAWLILTTTTTARAENSECPRAWGSLFVRKSVPIDWSRRAYWGFARMPEDMQAGFVRGVHRFIQFLPNQISRRWSGQPWDLIAYDRAVEILLQKPVGFFSERGLGVRYELGAFPVYTATLGLSLGVYSLISYGLDSAEDTIVDAWIDSEFPFAVIKELRDKNQIPVAEARELARSLRTALSNYYETLNSGTLPSGTAEEQRKFFQSPGVQVLFQHIPNLLDPEKLREMPGIRLRSNTEIRPKDETEKILYRINNNLLIKYAIVPTLMQDLLANRKILRDSQRFFNFVDNNSDLNLSPMLRDLLKHDNGAALLKEIILNPLTRALFQLATEQNKFGAVAMSNFVLKGEFYGARLAELEAVGADMINPNTDKPYALIDFQRAVVQEAMELKIAAPK